MQKAMQHARREPDIPILQLYGVVKTTLGHRVKGKHVSSAESHRDHQLFSPGEEKAIIDPCDIMGRLSLAQDMLNKRPISLRSLQHNIKGTTGSMAAKDIEEANKVYIIGVNWFDWFMLRYPDFKLGFVQYQECGRKEFLQALTLYAGRVFKRRIYGIVMRRVLLWAEMELEIWL